MENRLLINQRKYKLSKFSFNYPWPTQDFFIFQQKTCTLLTLHGKIEKYGNNTVITITTSRKG